MGQLRNKDKHDWAKLLYTREYLTQKEVAKRVGVTEKTVSNWRERGKWEEEKEAFSTSNLEQWKSLNRQLDELNRMIEGRDEGHRYPDSKEANVQAQLTAAKAKLNIETSLSETFEVFKTFLSFLRSNAPDKATEITPLMDSYVKSFLS